MDERSFFIGLLAGICVGAVLVIVLEGFLRPKRHLATEFPVLTEHLVARFPRIEQYPIDSRAFATAVENIRATNDLPPLQKSPRGCVTYSQLIVTEHELQAIAQGQAPEQVQVSPLPYSAPVQSPGVDSRLPTP